jgi:hypothetical protein
MMTDVSLIAAEKWLNELGVNTKSILDNILLVSRKSIDLLELSDNPETAHKLLIQELRAGLKINQLYWGGGDENNLWLQCF